MFSAIEETLTQTCRKDFRLDLASMQTACKLLGNPFQHYASIHIAGTNGKGSTAAFLESLLREANLTVGLITSPHLLTARERIQINREPISEKDLQKIYQDILTFLPSPSFLSYFEMLTLIGFVYFARKRVDAAVVEVGLGGRLDATNVLQPKVAVLTPVSFDHEAYLGNTLTQIAAEKCGILKPGMEVVTAPQFPEVLAVIESRCKKLKLPLHKVEQPVEYSLGLFGEHQKNNAAAALKAAQVFLGPRSLSQASTQKALAQTRWPGRLEWISKSPPFLIDGAHNPAGIHVLSQFLQPCKKEGIPISLLFGVMADKNWKAMMTIIAPFVKRFILVQPQEERALDTSSMASFARKNRWPFEEGGKIKETLERFWPETPSPSSQELWVAAGSLYMIGEILCHFQQRDCAV